MRNKALCKRTSGGRVVHEYGERALVVLQVVLGQVGGGGNVAVGGGHLERKRQHSFYISFGKSRNIDFASMMSRKKIRRWRCARKINEQESETEYSEGAKKKAGRGMHWNFESRDSLEALGLRGSLRTVGVLQRRGKKRRREGKRGEFLISQTSDIH